METRVDTGFKYFAFISYSRKDSRAAAFLHRKLEKFRIPIKRVPEEMRKGLRKFVRPVFRDKRDLEVGESSFTEDVMKALAESRFIIVICSPNSAQSLWVDNEVKYFLSTHDNDLSKVVPVVLAGNPDSGDSKTECLCQYLLSEKAKSTIVKRNLPTMIPDDGESEKAGWEAGIVGVLSYMLKLKRQDVKATIDAEKMRQMRIYAAIGVVCSAIFAALAFWAVKAERTAKRNWQLAEDNRMQAVEQRDRAVEAERLADANRKQAIEQRDRAVEAERVADANRKQAVEQRDRAVEAERMADANRRKAEENEKRAVEEEKNAKEKAFLAEQTVDFLKRMLQEAKPDEHGAKNIIDLLTEQQSKVYLLNPPELRYSVSLTLGQIMLEQSLFVPASRMLKYAYDFGKANEKKIGKMELALAATLLSLAYNQMPGRSEEALALLSEVETLRRQQGEDDFSMAMTYFNMAASYFAKHDYVNSRKLCEKTLECTGGKPCRATLLAFGQSASIALEQGEYGKAEELCEKAFEVSSEMNEEPETDLIETFVQASCQNGKYDIAKRTAEDALAKLKRSGVVTSAVVGLENNLGLIADASGDIKDAIEHYKAAIKAGEGIWTEGHGNLAHIISNLGVAYKKAGGTHMAISQLSRAVAMIERLEGKNSISLYMPLVNLGAIYTTVGEHEKALSVLEHAYDICVKKFGTDSAQLPGVVFHIADLKDVSGHAEEAKNGYEEALRLMRLNNLTETELMVSCLGNLACNYSERGVKNRAKELMDEAVALARKVLPVGNETRQVVMRAYENVAQVPLSTSNNGGVITESNWNVKKSAACKALEERRNDEAETLYLELLQYLENNNQAFTTDYALICNQLGILAERKSDLRGALAYYKKSLDTDFLIRGTNDIEVAISCNNMANILRRLGDFQGEEMALLRALPAYEAANHSGVSVVYTKLGRVKERQKAWEEAMTWYKKALNFDTSNKGMNTAKVAVDYEGIGDVQKKLGNFTAAKESYCHAVSIRKSLGESDTTKKMGYLNNEIGNTLWRGGQKGEALVYYRNAYEIDLVNYGLTNRETIVALGNMGDCERAVKDYTNAIAHLTLAAEMKKNMPEFDAHEYGMAMNDLAIAQSDSGDHDGALRTYAVALEYDIRALGREDSNVMTVYGNIAEEYKTIGKWEDAIVNSRKALDIALLLYGEENEKTRQYYRGLGDCLYNAKKYDKCVVIRKKYLDIVRGSKDLGAEFVAKAHKLYADALAAQHDYENARINRHLAVEMYRKCGEEYLESVAISLCHLGGALRELGEFELAAEAFLEAKKMYDDKHFKYEKGGVVDTSIHQRLEECRGLVSGRFKLVIKMKKITKNGQAERLGVKAGDVWCALDEWKADEYPDGKGLWNSLVKFMVHFNGKPRQLTVYRLDNGKWVKKTFQFDGSVGGFVYGYDALPAEEFNAMKASCK